MTASEFASDGPGDDRGPTGSDAATDADWYRRRWTTIVLKECGDGWRATQTGVDVEGCGVTAADAAAAYCRRIAETGDEADDERERGGASPVRGGRDD